MKNELVQKEYELLDKAFHASPCLMAISTIQDGCYIKVNKCFEETTGFSAIEVVGRTSVDLNIFDNSTRIEVTKLLETRGTLKNIEISFKTKDGCNRIGLFSAEIIDFKGQQCILSVANDITQLKQHEREFLNLEKMNLIGQMAASIGHEVRNPMTCVRGYLQMFSKKNEFSAYKDSFILMIEELDRANSIISEFLSLSKDKNPKLIKKNINLIIETLAPLIVAYGMELQGNTSFDLGIVSDIELDEEEIRQLILNLCRNGFEAMPEGGVLTIKTYNEGTDVILSIMDQGKGINVTYLPKIGTPFFTTKEKGTGLGLTVCYSIVKRHRATIKINSKDNGTQVLIRFTSNS